MTHQEYQPPDILTFLSPRQTAQLMVQADRKPMEWIRQLEYDGYRIGRIPSPEYRNPNDPRNPLIQIDPHQVVLLYRPGEYETYPNLYAAAVDQATPRQPKVR